MAASRMGQSKAGACKFTPPAGMEAGTQTWLGDCVGGVAQGPGVLRTSRSGRPPVLYFGSMIGGRPATGIVERNGDFYPMAGSDREANIRAFRAAGEGTKAAARRFETQGNSPSAKYYNFEAKRLDNTLD